MKDLLKVAIGGVVGIGVITAFGLHARQLSRLPRPTGRAASGFLSTAETGQQAAG